MNYINIVNKYNYYNNNILYIFKKKFIILNSVLNNKIFNFFYKFLFLLNNNKKNFKSKFYSSFSSKKIRNQKGLGKSRIRTKSSNIFVGGCYCFGFREKNFKKYIFKYINYFFNIININKRNLINVIDYCYLKLIFSLYIGNNNYFNFYYYLFYLNKAYLTKYNYNFINNSKTIDLCIKNLKFYNNLIFI